MAKIEDISRLRTESKSPYDKSTQRYNVTLSGRCFTSDEILTKYLALILQSGFIKGNDLPLSTAFISKAGIGKSRLLKVLKKLKYVYYVTDITPKFLIDEFLPKLNEGKYRFICIPDFTNITDSHSRRTGSTIVSLLRNITEEGVNKIKDFGMTFESEKAVKAGLITATTKSSYSGFRESWKTTGFLSRMLPFSFTHNSMTKTSILNDIENEKKNDIEELPYSIRTHGIKEIKPSPELIIQFRVISQLIGDYTDSMPYRAEIQLIKLVKANVILRNGDTITQADINEIMFLVNWLNYKFESI